MALTIKRLRWVIAAAALLLTVVVAAYIGFGRYRAVKAYLDVIRKAGITVSHDTNGLTVSKSEQGRTIFTLHAQKGTQIGDGKWSLHGVNVILYSRDGQHNDVINGDDFTYDEHEGIVRAIGEVHMDLEAPDSLTSAGRSSLRPLAGAPPGSGHEPANVIHVRTSGVVYLRKLGIAATDQRVEFYYGGIEGTAQGAEYNTSLSTLRLLSNVTATGILRNRPFVLHAASADIDRSANVATLPHTVATSAGHTASADLTLLNLRSDGSIASAKATGHVRLTNATQTVEAAELDSTFTKSTVPIAARLSGGVQLVDTDPMRPAQGSSPAADLAFDARGLLSSVTTSGASQLVLTDKRTLPGGLLREVHADRIVARFSTAGKGSNAKSQLTDIQATGSAEIRGESLDTRAHPPASQGSGVPIKLTTLTADDLDLTLVNTVNGHAEPDKLFAHGHTLLRENAPTGEVETSTGDQLSAVFAQAETHGKQQLALASAIQTGHVLVQRLAPRRNGRTGSQSQPQEFGTATAESASYNSVTGKLTLIGNTHLTQDDATLTAATVILDQRNQDADAAGNVQTTFARAATGASSFPPADFTHVLSTTAHFTHKTQQAEFRGTDAQPARMWQQASQVQAATLILDDRNHTFSARPGSSAGLVHAVFADVSSETHGPSSAFHSEKSSMGRMRYVRVAAARMDYSDARREAVFTGPQGVLLEADAGTIRAQQATAYLTPAAKTPAAKPTGAPSSKESTPFNGSLDRVVITGDVRLEQPGRHGTGEELVYTAATGASVLTGTPVKPPVIVDTQHGNITGSSLLFADAGSTIVVLGNAPGTSPRRVHTETQIQQGKEERQ
ncbi:hypothetical protein GOB94_13515 [Granulicella sp. 5B5]|uniref:LPS export ABC transporter periplasmic protein LptC n=1 Tax=Granulicella sp. 5B5 TaxID=1617967 RepID=UPI0015F5E353|nr:LptA/OstA family protein [Granulicella sp. 5B5]QMV19589.1 hypothetical protein GOB94_13515 [Granulicella sp. 5B5]